MKLIPFTAWAKRHGATPSELRSWRRSVKLAPYMKQVKQTRRVWYIQADAPKLK